MHILYVRIYLNASGDRRKKRWFMIATAFSSAAQSQFRKDIDRRVREPLRNSNLHRDHLDYSVSQCRSRVRENSKLSRDMVSPEFDTSA